MCTFDIHQKKSDVSFFVWEMTLGIVGFWIQTCVCVDLSNELLNHVCAPPHTVRVAAAHNMHAARNTIFGTEILERDRSLETFDVIGY